ncbi:hypothetical protein BDV28DRAFT_135914 [Aspergillus coremiiformis]|uniref:Uncharacterized protein n=1 Tax=Aspergillus coremiiformis TaxID=138285 RepID=A0A5N6Z4D8_9EURO|nr:hypothetical protein BDV28DRAFT_135914 [Aspergillus coremiiformis]
MGKQNAINSNLTNSSGPSITRSSINQCSFSDLTPADSIQRSDLDSVNVFRKSFPEGSRMAPMSADTTIQRSKISHSVVANSYIRRCQLANCELVDVSSAKLTKANHAKLENVRSARRSSVQNSTVTGWSTLIRSQVNGSSVTEESALRRSHLEDVRVARSRMTRSTLRNCDVSDCVIVRSDFTGMVLQHGVWKNGRLVGRVGNGEVVAMTQSGQKIADFSSDQLVTQDAKVWADSNNPDSDSSENESLDSQDLPPPYEP